MFLLPLPPSPRPTLIVLHRYAATAAQAAEVLAQAAMMPLCWPMPVYVTAVGLADTADDAAGAAQTAVAALAGSLFVGSTVDAADVANVNAAVAAGRLPRQRQRRW